MKTRSWPGKFEFPEKKDQKILGVALPLALALGGILGVRWEAHVPVLILELCLGFSWGGIMFVLLDALSLADAEFYNGQSRPPIKKMLSIILIWGFLLSFSLLIGTLFVSVPFIGPLVVVFLAIWLNLITPDICWNLRMLYRKVSR